MNDKNDNSNELYTIVFIFKEKRYLTLWYMSDEDGFILNDMMTEIHCDEKDILNLSDIKCNSILTFWNIVFDIANSLNVYFIGNSNNKEITSIYNKLFYGCNLPAFRKGGGEFIPNWTKKEIEILTVILENGLNIVFKYLI